MSWVAQSGGELIPSSWRRVGVRGADLSHIRAVLAASPIRGGGREPAPFTWLRLLHPAYEIEPDGRTRAVSWTELGRRRGALTVPGVGADLPDALRLPIQDFENGFALGGARFEPPDQGSLPELLSAVLVHTIGALRSGPQLLRVGVWAGWAAVRAAVTIGETPEIGGRDQRT